MSRSLNVSETERKCSNCFKVKPKTEFYKKGTGLQTHCKACHPEIQRAWVDRAQERKIKKRSIHT